MKRPDINRPVPMTSNARRRQVPTGSAWDSSTQRSASCPLACTTCAGQWTVCCPGSKRGGTCEGQVLILTLNQSLLPYHSCLPWSHLTAQEAVHHGELQQDRPKSQAASDIGYRRPRVGWKKGLIRAQLWWAGSRTPHQYPPQLGRDLRMGPYWLGMSAAILAG